MAVILILHRIADRKQLVVIHRMRPFDLLCRHAKIIVVDRFRQRWRFFPFFSLIGSVSPGRIDVIPVPVEENDIPGMSFPVHISGNEHRRYPCKLAQILERLGIALADGTLV